MEDYIKEALQQQFIRPSTSSAASIFFFVGKKDGGLRPCIDYRTLNDHTVKLPYPLPLVPAALEELCGACIFSKLDLHSAYNLIRIREGDEWKTAFVTPSGHYEYWVMPYGLSNYPPVFQEFMIEVLRTRGRSKPSGTGPSLSQLRNFNDSSASQISTGGSFRISVSSQLPPLQYSIRNPSLCPGTPKLEPPTRSSRRSSALLPSSHIKSPNSHS